MGYFGRFEKGQDQGGERDNSAANRGAIIAIAETLVRAAVDAMRRNPDNINTQAVSDDIYQGQPAHEQYPAVTEPLDVNHVRADVARAAAQNNYRQPAEVAQGHYIAGITGDGDNNDKWGLAA